MNPVKVFRALQRIVRQRRDSVVQLMPQYAPRLSVRAVDDMLTPGTNAHALMTAICMVIAWELSAEDAKRRAVGDDWMGG